MDVNPASLSDCAEEWCKIHGCPVICSYLFLFFILNIVTPSSKAKRKFIGVNQSNNASRCILTWNTWQIRTELSKPFYVLFPKRFYLIPGFHSTQHGSHYLEHHFEEIISDFSLLTTITQYVKMVFEFIFSISFCYLNSRRSRQTTTFNLFFEI